MLRKIKPREIAYEETAPYEIVRRFVNHRDAFVEELFEETPSLFGEEKED